MSTELLLNPQVDETRDWKEVFDGLNDTATQLYLVIDERLRERGLYEVLATSSLELEELRERLDIDAGVALRFRLCVESLRNLGTLGFDGRRVSARTTEEPEVEADRELVIWAFGPLIDAYLEIYRNGSILDPGFVLGFDEDMDAIWDGLFNAPINLVPRDAAVDWIARPDAHVLDLGFGTPDTMRQLSAAVGDGGGVYGVDSSEHFVRRAEAELDGVGPVKQITHADLNRGLGMFEDDSFDGAMFMGALQFIRDPSALFAELRRVLKPGTPLAIGTFFVDTPVYSSPGLQLHGTFFDPPVIVRSEEEVVEALRSAGFELNMTFHISCFTSLYLRRVPANKVD